MMHKRMAMVTAALLATTAGLGLGQTGAWAQGTVVEPETKEHAAKIAWFRDAKFGLFIHWGLYAVPAGEWKGKPIAGIGEWIMNRAQIPVKEYEHLAKQFNPVKFDAEAWAQMAEDAGMKYIVITSKHHDGFAMFGSKVSPYNVVDATPFHRDPMKELAAACARHHLKFGFYYSQAQDWHDPNGAGNTWDFGPDDKKDFDKYIRDKALPQVREILTGYGPICLVWFDTPRMMTHERAQQFADMVHALQPDCLIDGRLGIAGDYQSTGDNKIPDTVLAGDWEVPATLNKTWGFKKDDTDWKTPDDLVFKLVDIVSKGGNYLLNVGPTSEGVVPQASQDNLRTVGKWLKTNGEAIYGAKATPFGAELGQATSEIDPKTNKPRFREDKAWRCTVKPGHLYITLFQWPSDHTFVLPSGQGKVSKAALLSAPSTPLTVVTTPDGKTTISLPESSPDSLGTVLRLDLAP